MWISLCLAIQFVFERLFIDLFQIFAHNYVLSESHANVVAFRPLQFLSAARQIIKKK